MKSNENYMIIYVEKRMDFYKKSTKTSEFSNVLGKEINSQKSVVFLYTSNKQSKNQKI